MVATMNRLPSGFLHPCVGPLFACFALFSGCGKPVAPVKAPVIASRAAAREDLSYLKARPVGLPVGGVPWITHVLTVDLDQDGRLDAVVCEGRENTVTWLRQTRPGVFEESLLAGDMRAPVHVEAVDMDKDGDLDLLVSSMSVVFPNNDKIGAVIILENDGKCRFQPHIIAENIARVTDIRAADFDGDGALDLAVGQFGYDQGEVRWMRRTGPWEFTSQIILDLSGTVNIAVGDYNGDRTQDIVALVSQQWEEVYLFENDGKGNFRSRVIWGSTNEDYACSGMISADLNRDGRPDLIFTNGDGFGPAALPGPRPWHGVQWLENAGSGNFRFQRIGDLPGAYSPVCIDLDGDGANDVVAISAFNEWEKPKALSMVWYQNDGRQGFKPRILAYTPTHLLALAAGDWDNDGRPELISGAFHAYPPYERQTRLMYWERPSP